MPEIKPNSQGLGGRSIRDGSPRDARLDASGARRRPETCGRSSEMRARVAALCVGTDVAVAGNTGSPQGASRRQGLRLPASFPRADEEMGLDWLDFPRESLECPQQQLSPRQREAHLHRLAWASTRSVASAETPAHAPAPGYRSATSAASKRLRQVRRASQGREGMQLPRLPVSRNSTVRWELSHQDIVGAGPATVKRLDWPLDWQPPRGSSGST